MLDVKELRNTIDYALTKAKVAHNWCKEFVDKNPSDDNKECLKKAKVNLDIMQDMDKMAQDLIEDEAE